LSDEKWVKSWVIHVTKTQNFGSLPNCRYCADRAQSLPWPAPNIWLTTFQISLNRFTFGRVIVGRVKAVKGLSNTRRSYSFSPSNNCRKQRQLNKLCFSMITVHTSVAISSLSVNLQTCNKSQPTRKASIVLI